MSSEPLFETRVAKGRVGYKFFASSMVIGICLILFYRIAHLPTTSTGDRWVWIGMFLAEVWFGFYWILTQSVRWNPVNRSIFKERVSKRHDDVFVCTANPTLEPPSLVITTVLSVMVYDYPRHKLALYLEASRFARIQVPFCRELGVEPRSSTAYFSSEGHPPPDASVACQWLATKRSFEETKTRIEAAVEIGRVPDEIKEEHRDFR